MQAASPWKVEAPKQGSGVSQQAPPLRDLQHLRSHLETKGILQVSPERNRGFAEDSSAAKKNTTPNSKAHFQLKLRGWGLCFQASWYKSQATRPYNQSFNPPTEAV